MVQGKFKKASVSASVQKKQKQKNAKAFTRRANAPIMPKKANYTEHQKLKNAISKNLYKSIEKEMRSRAVTGTLNLSKAQEAVAKHNKTVPAPSTSTGSA